MRNVTIGAMLALTLATVTHVRADEIDKKTRITVNEPIMIPGKTLAPGKYVIKLMRSATNRNIVQIFNDDENQLQATILAINNYRVTPTDKTVLQYWETPTGNPPALRAWFAPGDNSGQEFAYPKNVAQRIARENNNAKVPFYNPTGNGEPSVNDLSTIEVNDAQGAADTATEPVPVPVAIPPSAPPVKAPETILAQAERPSTTLFAQNTPPANNPTGQLPQTAGSLGWVLLIGMVTLLLATTIRLTRRA